MRWLWTALVPGAIVLAGCGSSGSGDDTSTFPGDDAGADVTIGPGPGPLFGDGSTSETSASSCTPRTCTQAGATCGPVADGCGKLIECGTCTAPATCGGGGTPSVCGGVAGCQPKDCAALKVNCGQQGDGCGTVIDCGTCTAPATCGGGGTGSVCGGVAGCVPLTACPAGMNCGVVADGCGKTVTCGTTCPSGESCGGGGQANVCGSKNILPDGGFTDAGGNTCIPVPKATACTGIGCGPASDGCGNTYDCGQCTGSDTCGGGGTPSQCGHPTCKPNTTCPANIKCGTIGDGCGGTLPCGTCTGADSCGGGGTPYQCGHPTCTPATACPNGVNCGPWSDGCGGSIPSCGKCTSPDICGGGGQPSVCGSSNTGDAGACTNLCPLIPKCDGGGTTTLSGTVVAPTIPDVANGITPDPVVGALVYIPNALNGALAALPDGVSCDTCNAQASGSPLVSDTTDFKGNFKLTGVPVNSSQPIPLVIQLGKWRREVWLVVKGGDAGTEPTFTIQPCQDNVLPQELTRLPRKQKEGTPYDNIPLFAIQTGDVDALECVLRKMGINDKEFGDPPTTGKAYQAGAPRVQFYQGKPDNPGAGGADPQGGAIIDNKTPTEDVLWGSTTTLDQYDVVLLECEGGEDDETTTRRKAMVSYAGAGGRVYATHFSYVWLWADDWAATGDFSIASNPPAVDDPVPATVDLSFQKGIEFSNWLKYVKAATNPTAPATTAATMSIDKPRNNMKSVTQSSGAQQWIYAKNQDGTQFPLHYTFNTPILKPGQDAGAVKQCGRALYSDFHVSDAVTNGVTYPNECTAGKLTAQEKILEYMLFDLTSCVQPDNPPPPVCTPLTKCPSNVTCGPWPNGCDTGTLNCGTCAAGSACINGTCSSCTTLSCKDQGIQCGPAGDGCGGVIPTCGTCLPTQLCQGGQCVTPTCPKQPCPANIHCGPAGDGCGGTQSCGTCSPPQTCGGGGTPGTCGQADADICAPLTCAAQNVHCGPAGDGCGNLIDCGPCPTGQTCGGGGTPGVCGAPSCTPATCASVGANCGQVADGCGGLTPDCGKCTGDATCGGGGVANQCGTPPCTPRTCKDAGADCGPVADGCGGVVQCGTCSGTQTCGGGGTPSVCGGGIK